MNPIKEIDQIFIDSLNNDYDYEWAEEAVFGVPTGTLKNLFIKIDKDQAWEEFFDLAKVKRGQWLVDISNFIPRELDSCTRVLVKLMSFANDEHSKLIFCSEVDTWAWNKHNKNLLPEVIDMMESYVSSFDKDTLKIMKKKLHDVEVNLEKKHNCLYAEERGQSQ